MPGPFTPTTLFPTDEEERQLQRPLTPQSDTPAFPLIPPDLADPLVQTMGRAKSTPSQKAAQVFDLQLKTGLPSDLVERNFDEIQKASDAAGFNAAAFRKSYPKLASWLEEHPLNARVAQDDFKPLGTLEHAARLGSAVARAPFAGWVQGANLGAYSAVRFLGEATEQVLGVAGYYPETPRAIAAWASDQNKAVEDAVKWIQGPLQGLSHNEQTVVSGAQSIGSTLPILAVAAAAPYVLPEMLGGVAAAGVEQQVARRAAAREFSERLSYYLMASQTGGQSYEQAREANLNPFTSAVFALGQGIIEAATEAPGITAMFKDIEEGTGLFKTLLHQVFTETFGEQIATFGQTFDEYLVGLQGDPAHGEGLAGGPGRVGEFFTDLPARWRDFKDTALATAVAVVGQTSVTHTAGRILQGLATKQSADQIIAARDQTKMAKESPAKTEEVIRRMVAPQVWVDAQLWDGYWKERNEDGAARAARHGGIAPETYALAVRDGEELEFDHPKYLATLETEHTAYWNGYLRPETGVGGGSEQAALLKEQVAQIEADKAAREAQGPATPDALQTIHERIVTDLTAQGVPLDEAQTNAELLTRQYEHAQRMGLDPEAMLAKRYAGLVGAVTTASATAAADPAVDLTTQQKQQKGPSLITEKPPQEAAPTTTTETAPATGLTAPLGALAAPAQAAPTTEASPFATASQDELLRATAHDDPTIAAQAQQEFDRRAAEQNVSITADLEQTSEPPPMQLNADELRGRMAERAGLPMSLGQQVITPLPLPTPYYSRLAQAVQNSNLKTGTLEEWGAQIRNSKTGFNTEELALMGLGNFATPPVTTREPLLFDILPKPTRLTKQEMLDFLTVHALKPTPVVLTGSDTKYGRYVVDGPAQHYEEHFLTFPDLPAVGEVVPPGGPLPRQPTIKVGDKRIPESGEFKQGKTSVRPVTVPGGTVPWTADAALTLRPTHLDGAVKGEAGGFDVYVDGHPWLTTENKRQHVWAATEAEATAHAQALWAEAGQSQEPQLDTPARPINERDVKTEVEDRASRQAEQSVTDAMIEARVQKEAVEAMRDWKPTPMHANAVWDEMADSGYHAAVDFRVISPEQVFTTAEDATAFGQAYIDSQHAEERALAEQDAQHWAGKQANRRAIRDEFIAQARDLIDEDALENTVRTEMLRAARRPGWSDGHGLYSHIKNPLVRLRLDMRMSDKGLALHVNEAQLSREDELDKIPPLLQGTIGYEIALKYLLDLAVKRNVSVITFATGEENAALYSLEHDVKKMDFAPKPGYGLKIVERKFAGGISFEVERADGKVVAQADTRAKAQGAVRRQRNVDTRGYWNLTVTMQGGTEVKLVVDPSPDPRTGKNQHVVLESNRAEYKNKPLAQLMQQEYIDRMQQEGTGSFTGDDLKFGGAGLVRLYNQLLPSLMRDLKAMKMAKAKLSTATIDTRKRGNADRGPADHGGAVAVRRIPNQPRFQLVLADGSVWGSYADMAEAEVAFTDWNREAADVTANDAKAQSPHLALEVTPTLANVVRGGQYLFQPARTGPSLVTEQPPKEGAAVALPQDVIKTVDVKPDPKTGKPWFATAPVMYEGDAPTISTRVPTAVDAESQTKVLQTRLQTVLDAGGTIAERMAKVVSKHGVLTNAELKAATTPEQLLETFVNRLTDNLEFLWNMTSDPARGWSKEIRDRARLWYDGAHNLSREVAAEHGLQLQQAAGVFAALSPQMDWFRNVALGKRLIQHVRTLDESNRIFDEKLFRDYEQARAKAFKLELKRILQTEKKDSDGFIIEGQEEADHAMHDFVAQIHDERAAFENVAWRDLPLEGKAKMLRAVDEEGDRRYRIISPEGQEGDWVRKNPTKKQRANGELGTPSTVAWGSYFAIENAISIVYDGELGNIHKRLGGEHKVRSFFNNISAPWSDFSVTIDTHAIAAALLQPLGAGAKAVVQAMAGPGDNAAGLSGTSALYGEAYFRLAKRLGVLPEEVQAVLPREVQSVTWEGGRGLFRPEQKRDKKLVKKINGLWKAHRQGKITTDEVRERIVAAVTRMEQPAWAHAAPGLAADQGGVPAGMVRPQPSGAPVSIGSGDAVAGATGPAGQPADQRAADVSTDRAGQPAAVAPTGRPDQSLGQPPAEGPPPERRGQIDFSQTGGAGIITRLAGADRSTFIHEFGGHVGLEVMGDTVEALTREDPANLTPPQRRFLNDYHTIFLPWLGIDTRDEADRTASGRRYSAEQHEKWAEAFEDYLLIGRAPSIELRPVFARVRAWMLQLYGETPRPTRNLLTPEVQGFMDRLLASDEAIAAAETDGATQQIFLTPEQAQMTPEEFALYREAVEEASMEARDDIAADVQAEDQREQSAERKARREVVEDEVTDRLQALPVYRVASYIRYGTHPDGTPFSGTEAAPMKLDRSLVVQAIGETATKMLPKPYLYTTKDGIDPTEAAHQFGFSSAADMLQQLAATPKIDDVIKEQTDAQMQQEYAQRGGLLANAERLAEKANQALAGEARDRVIRAEIRALRKLQRTVTPFARQAAGQTRTQQQARTQAFAAIPSQQTLAKAAELRVSTITLRQLHPHVFWVAARQANRAAVEATRRQDYNAAVAAHTQQLVNLANYRAATAALQDTAERVASARRLDTPTAQRRIGKASQSDLAQIQGVLERYEFVRVSARTVERRAAMERWAAAAKAEGFEVDLTAAQLDDSRRINFQELTYGELVSVTDGLDKMLHLNQRRAKYLASKDQRDASVIEDELAGSIRANHELSKPKAAFTKMDDRTRWVEDFWASHKKIAFIINAMDGFQDGGPMWHAVMRVLNDAANNEQERKANAGVDYWTNVLNKFYPGKEQAVLFQDITVPGVPDRIQKQTALAVTLNYGNPNGRERLLNDQSRKWTEAQVLAMINSLDQRDIDFVKATWKFNDQFKKEIFEQQTKIVGVPPVEVEALGFDTKFGHLDGGYYHIAYDSRLSPRVRQFNEAQIAEHGFMAAYARSTTRQGFDETQKETTGMSLKLEIPVQFTHTEEVIHSLSHREAISDVSRILNSKKVKAAITETWGDITYKQLTDAVQAIALGTLPSSKNSFEDIAAAGLRATQGAALFGNAFTAMVQWTGLFPGMAEIGVRPVMNGMVKWLRSGKSYENTVAFVASKSTLMRHRWETRDQDLADIRKALKTVGSPADLFLRKFSFDTATRETLINFYMQHIAYGQRIADMPVWLGAYAKFSEEHPNDDDLAVSLADQAVENSQGGGQVKDLAAIQRHGPMFRIWMAFYSYSNMILNQNVRAVQKTDFRSPSSVAKLAGNLMLLDLLPSMAMKVMAAVFGRVVLGGDDDDDDSWVTDFIREVGQDSLAGALNGVVGVRELSSLIQKLVGLDDQGTRGYPGPTGVRPFSVIYNLAAQVQQGEVDHAAISAANQFTGLFGLWPAGQVQHALDGFWALEDGTATNPFVLLVGPPPKSQRKKQRSVGAYRAQ